MKLSGIQRIGIVISVIAFLVSGGYSWMWGRDKLSIQDMHGLIYCENTFSPNERPSYESAQNADRRSTANFESCKKRFYERQVLRYEEHINSFPIVLAFVFGVIVFVWFVAWFLLGIGRWIRRGFA
jgi:hypothetical protein